ncbi:MAG: hypothetical protein JNM43_12525, partial [Planctomycetaceae bacterium]|nr:hypothetical protein [Planctomycetaceae bacterium]
MRQVTIRQRAATEYAKNVSGVLLALGMMLVSGAPVLAQQSQLPPAEQWLKTYVPAQKGVEIDTPPAAEFGKCRVASENGSVAVYGPANEILRRFSDSNGDRYPDMFRYYHLGLEVYREIDTNGDYKAKKNTRPDEYRWMNWGGTRWGIDQNEDGKIDVWKVLSAQEAARVAVEGLINGDLQAISTVMLNDADIQSLKVPAVMAKELQASVSDLAKKAQASVSAAGGKALNSKSQWVRFDPPLPGVILAEQSGSPADITVYENAMAYVQNGEKLDLISVGEMVQVGNVWKLVSMPTPLDTSGKAVVSVGGIFMRPGDGGSSGGGDPTEMPAEMQKLLVELQALDEKSPAPDAAPKTLVDYNVARANISEKLITMARSDDERAQWIQQFVDSVSTATQSGMYREGLARLQSMEEAVRANQALKGYVFYRRLMAEYAVRLKEDDGAKDEAEIKKAREATQKWWFEQL